VAEQASLMKTAQAVQPLHKLWTMNTGVTFSGGKAAGPWSWPHTCPVPWL